MSRDFPQLRVRISPELKSKLEVAAFNNNRTLTAEIEYRLQKSFDVDKYISDKPLNLRDPEIDSATLSISHDSELPAYKAHHSLQKNLNWSKSDIDKFREGVNCMMQMLEVMEDELPSDQMDQEVPTEKANEPSDDVKSKTTTKPKIDWTTFKL
jgi:hypothetical protein